MAKKSKISCGLNKSFLAFLTLLLPLVLFPGYGHAQGVYKAAHGEWEAIVFAGGSFLGDGVYPTPVEGSSQQSSRSVGLSYGTGFQAGIRVADNQWKHWGASFEYSYTNQPLTFTNLSDSVPSLGLGHAIHGFVYDVLYYPRDRDCRLRPFIFAGPGVSLFHINSSGKDAAAARGIHLSDSWKFAMNWGGGAKYLLAKQVAASFQFGDSISGVPSYGLPGTGKVQSGTYVPGFHPDGLMHNWLVGVGIAFQWDDN